MEKKGGEEEVHEKKSRLKKVFSKGKKNNTLPAKEKIGPFYTNDSKKEEQMKKKSCAGEDRNPKLPPFYFSG